MDYLVKYKKIKQGRNNMIKTLLEAILLPFTMMAILIDESKRINECGDWDRYHAKRNNK